MAIWSRLKKYLIRWPLYFILIVFPILIGISHYVHWQFYRAKMLQSLEKNLRHWPKFIEDLKTLDTQSIAKPITRTRNAAEFLSERVTWDPVEEVPVNEAQRAAHSARTVLQKYRQWGSDPAELAKLLSDPDLKSIDTAWTKELSNYDYLDLSVTARQKDHLSRLPRAHAIERVEIIASLPMPDLLQALDLASVAVLQAHLAKAPREDVLSAFGVLDTLFQLFQSSPTLVDQMLAVSTLGRKQRLVDALKIQGVEYVPLEMRLRIRRVSWMWAAVLYLTPLKEFEPALAEVRPYMKTTNFLCGGSDPIGTHSIFKDFLLTKWPLAPNFGPTLEREASHMKETAAICGIPLADILLSLPEPENIPAEFSIPYINSIYFSVLNSIAVPSYSRQYDDLAAEPTTN